MLFLMKLRLFSWRSVSGSVMAMRSVLNACTLVKFSADRRPRLRGKRHVEVLGAGHRLARFPARGVAHREAHRGLPGRGGDAHVEASVGGQRRALSVDGRLGP